MDELYGRNLWREHTCQTCHAKFRASRIDARYCSGRCRQYWTRHGEPYPGVVPVERPGPGLFDYIPIPPEPASGEPVKLEPIAEQVIATVIEIVTPPAIAGGVTPKSKDLDQSATKATEAKSQKKAQTKPTPKQKRSKKNGNAK